MKNSVWVIITCPTWKLHVRSLIGQNLLKLWNVVFQKDKNHHSYLY